MLDATMSTEARLAVKLQAQREARLKARPIAERISPEDGKVKVWHIADQKWVRLWPVDARQHVEAGVVLLEKPEGTAALNDSDEDEDPRDVVLSMDMTVAELREIAEDKGVDLTGLSKKDEIFTALSLALAQTPGDSE